tara:strand:+ start:149 stop:577 length:429 start_codon:yes stop_codon:yes gene_type:complete
MKAKTFENLIRRIVREEIDYALRREIKSLKEDLRDEIKPIIKEQSITNEQSIPNNVKNSLKEKIMGKKPIKKQNFVKDNTLNDLLNETAQGDTNTQTAMAPVTDPFSSSDVLPTDIMPTPVQKVVNRDYRSLMKAIEKKKNK